MIIISSQLNLLKIQVRKISGIGTVTQCPMVHGQSNPYSRSMIPKSPTRSSSLALVYQLPLLSLAWSFVLAFHGGKESRFGRALGGPPLTWFEKAKNFGNQSRLNSGSPQTMTTIVRCQILNKLVEIRRKLILFKIYLSTRKRTRMAHQLARDPWVNLEATKAIQKSILKEILPSRP